jgi:hypothetical protein
MRDGASIAVSAAGSAAVPRETFVSAGAVT